MVVYIALSENPHGIVIVTVLWSLTALAGTFLGLRLYAKLVRRRRLWWDDYFIVVAWIFLLASCSSSTANSRLGFGLRIREIPRENLIRLNIQSNISGFTSVLSVAYSKTSFGITLLRLTDGGTKWFIIGLLILLNITHYVAALLFWVSCSPPAKIWNHALQGKCLPVRVIVHYSLFVAAWSAFSDFALALLPWRLLLRYNMYNRENIGAAVAMSMGVFAGIACVVKMTTFTLLKHKDFSHHALPLVLWGFAEPSLTIVAASIPMMRHLFRNFSRPSDLPTLQMSTSVHDSVHQQQQQNNQNHQQHRHWQRHLARANHNHHHHHHHDEPSVDDKSRPPHQRHRHNHHHRHHHHPPARDDSRSDRSILVPGSSSAGTLGASDGSGERLPGGSGGRRAQAAVYEMESFDKAVSHG